MVDAAHVRTTVGCCADFLTGLSGADWSLPVPDLDMTVAEAVAHAAEVCLWYAIDLAAAGDELESVEHHVQPHGASEDLIGIVRAYGAVVAAVVDAAPASARGFHPMGAADPSGFAAMACDEMLVHTDDAARGLGALFEPSPNIAEPVLRRLFPWVTPVTDPWAQLKWANGRIPLDDQPKLAGWVWHCAPLDEWDGTVPIRSCAALFA